MKKIVADASPLISLARIHQIDLLRKLFDQVIIPPVVGEELKLSDKPGGLLFQTATWLIEEDLESDEVLKQISTNLSDGERHAIALSHQLGYELLIDELSGRKEAEKTGVVVKGTIGLLLKAKDEGLIEAVKPMIENLIRQGFWVSTRFYEQALEKAGEEG